MQLNFSKFGAWKVRGGPYKRENTVFNTYSECLTARMPPASQCPYSFQRVGSNSISALVTALLRACECAAAAAATTRIRFLILLLRPRRCPAAAAKDNVAVSIYLNESENDRCCCIKRGTHAGARWGITAYAVHVLAVLPDGLDQFLLMSMLWTHHLLLY